MISRIPGQASNDAQEKIAGIAAAGQPGADTQSVDARGGIFVLALSVLLLTSSVAEARHHHHHRHHVRMHEAPAPKPPDILGDPLSPFGQLRLQEHMQRN